MVREYLGRKLLMLAIYIMPKEYSQIIRQAIVIAADMEMIKMEEGVHRD